MKKLIIIAAACGFLYGLTIAGPSIAADYKDRVRASK